MACRLRLALKRCIAQHELGEGVAPAIFGFPEELHTFGELLPCAHDVTLREARAPKLIECHSQAVLVTERPEARHALSEKLRGRGEITHDPRLLAGGVQRPRVGQALWVRIRLRQGGFAPGSPLASA